MKYPFLLPFLTLQPILLSSSYVRSGSHVLLLRVCVSTKQCLLTMELGEVTGRAKSDYLTIYLAVKKEKKRKENKRKSLTQLSRPTLTPLE